MINMVFIIIMQGKRQSKRILHMRNRKKLRKKRSRKHTPRKQRGGFKLSSIINRLPIEMHIPGYSFCGPGTRLAMRLKRGDKGINRLDRICKKHDIDYSKARNQSDYAKADRDMIKAIDDLPGKKTMTERMVRQIIKTKKWLERK